MKKTTFDRLDLDLYSEKLENGLQVFVVPMPKINNIYATFSTNYGSNQSQFVPLNEKKMITVPNGIAHFLEHKMFEQPEGKQEPFAFYAERGSDANANTSKFKTTYLFSGTEFFKENLEFLLDYVQEPYFTDENVEKEKGIIEQEIKMYEDEPMSHLYDSLIANLFVKSPMGIPIAGTVKSVYEITKEDLYKCYHTFYHPSNMFVVVTGNVDPEEVITIVKENQAKKEFEAASPIKLKEENEPDTVLVKEGTDTMTVAVPKVMLAYKLNVKNKLLSPITIGHYLSIWFSGLFDATTDFNEQLKKEGITNQNLDFDSLYAYEHTIMFVGTDTESKEQFIKKIEEQIKNGVVTEEQFNRKKKVILSSFLYNSDNLYSINEKIMDDLIEHKKVILDDYKIVEALDYKEFQKFISELDKSNMASYIINPEK